MEPSPRYRSTGLKTRGTLVALAIVLLAGVSLVHAQDRGHVGAMLDWEVGARAVAMGGAYVAIAEGPTGVWWNPAGLAQVRDDYLELAYRRMSFDRLAGYASYAHPFGKEEAAIGLTWTYAGVGDVFSYDLDGAVGEQISDYTNALSFSFARRFTERTAPVAFALGFNARYMQHNIANINAYTIGFDLGAHLRYPLRRSIASDDVPPEVRVGLSVARLNQKYPWTTDEYWIPQGQNQGASFDEKFPVLVRGGAAGRLWQGKGLVAFDLEYNEELGTDWHLGAEGRFRNQIALRAGLNDGEPAFGVGLETPVRPGMRVLVDYAFSAQRDAIDPDHLVSLGIRF